MLREEYISAFALLIFVILDVLSIIPNKAYQTFMVIVQGVIFSGALFIGGGWYVGTALGLIGLSILVIAADGHDRINMSLPAPNGVRKGMVKVALLCAICSSVTVTTLSLAYLPPAVTTPNLYAGASGAPNANNTLYIAVLGSPLSGPDLDYLNAELGSGGAYVKIGASLVSWYMSQLNTASLNYTYNPAAELYAELNASVANNIPILVHFNGGNWGTYLHDNELVNDTWHNASYLQWDQFNAYAPAAPSPGGLTDRMFCLSKYSPLFAYRLANVRIAAHVVKEFSIAYPQLFIGVSMDSEINLCAASTAEAKSRGVGSVYDYNPLVIREFREWLQARYGSIGDLNARFCLSFDSWAAVDPPRVYAEGNPWFEEWTDFRIQLVRNNVEAQARAVHEEGIPEELIYAHQILDEPSSKTARYIRCDTLATATIEHGRIGITRYGLIDAQKFKTIYDTAGFNWGIFEWNINSTTLNTYENYLFMFRAMYQFGVRVICPYAWWSGWPYELLSIMDNANFKRAIRDFCQAVGDKPRGTSPNGFLTAANVIESMYLGPNQYFNKVPFDLIILPCIFAGTLAAINIGKIARKFVKMKVR
jgi:hypothetical protein